VSRHDEDRLDDILEAVAAIRGHLTRGSLDDGLVFDAVRIRLVEIGEAVKALPFDILDGEPEIDWRAIARSRDLLTHHYWDTAHAVVQHVVEHQLEELVAAVTRLQGRTG
jgi:uncharacterized protein with HEPN domain